MSRDWRTSPSYDDGPSYTFDATLVLTPVSILHPHDTHDQWFWVAMDDGTRFGLGEKLAGPFDTLDAAKAAYILLTTALSSARE